MQTLVPLLLIEQSTQYLMVLVQMESRFLEHGTANSNVPAVLDQGDVIVHVRVTDADYNVSAQGEDKIQDANVTLNIERGSNSQFLATYGNTCSLFR